MSSAAALHHVEQGSGSAVLVLHGFTGCAEAMGPIAALLAESHRVVAVDLAGHGSSRAPDDGYTMAAAVEDVARVVDRLGLAPVHLFGYSMGGRVALSYAVARPGEAASLVAVGVSAGIPDAAERADRAAADAALADRIERKGIGWFVDYWSALPILRPASERGVAAAEWMHALRLRNDPRALAAALRGLGTGTMPPLHDRLTELDVPALLLAGGEDAKYRAVAVALAGSMPDARFAVVDAAGHAAHIDDPESVAGTALSFLAEIDARRAA